MSTSRQEKLDKLRRKEAKEERITKFIFIGIAVVVAAVVVLGITMAIRSVPEEVAGGDMKPTKVTAQGGFRIGTTGSVIAPDAEAADGAVRAELFFDPMCPGCASVEREAGPRFLEAAKNGEIDLHMNPLSFLDRQSSDNYSSRAVNAVVEVAEHSPEHMMAFVTAIYSEENHPSEGSSYTPVTDEDFANMAQSVGVPESVTANFKNKRYLNWVQSHTTEQAARSEVFPEGLTTPTMVLGGSVKDGKLEGHTRVAFGSTDSITAFDQELAKHKG